MSKIEKIIHDHFSQVMGRSATHTRWDDLAFEKSGLESLGDPFSEDELKNAINLMPDVKALDPNGFAGAFYKCCWKTIKEYVMRAINLFGNFHVANFHWFKLREYRAIA
jgi:hypothetical protein